MTDTFGAGVAVDELGAFWEVKIDIIKSVENEKRTISIVGATRCII